jgi:prolyl-tRNA synthetase
MVMGCYGIGSGRLIASVIEESHDDNGIIWPVSIAPYHLYLASLATDRTPEVTAAADRIYAQLTEAGVEVLYDDRDERAGVKFNDADLIGLPLRLTVGKRGVENGIAELKFRRTGEVREVALDDIVAGINAALDEEWAVIHALLKAEPMG